MRFSLKTSPVRINRSEHSPTGVGANKGEVHQKFRRTEGPCRFGFPRKLWILQGRFSRVDLFFIVSGYLITSLLFEEYQVTGKISFGKFYARRALRLVPPLVIGIVIANLL